MEAPDALRNRIPLRVAEELRRYPPFSILAADVVEQLAKAASVQVSVKHETLWQQGSIPAGELHFLARGRVEYHWDRDGGSELVDVRDVGDLLGLTALVEGVAYQVSAVAAEDCLLFSLPWEMVSARLDENDEARHYIHRHLFWVTRVGGAVPTTSAPLTPPDPGVPGRAKGILEAQLGSAQVVIARGGENRLVTCRPDDPVSTVAERMARADLDSVIVVDERRHPLAILTAKDLVEHVIVGRASRERPVSTLMGGPPVTVEENASAIAATLLMMQRKVSWVCVTEDGSPDSPVLAIWSDRALMRRSGYHPAGLMRDLGRVTSLPRARELSDEIERLVGIYLQAGVSSILVGQICAELYDQLVQRLLTLAREEAVAAGEPPPDVPWAWMSVGSDGRREQILRTDMDNALVFASSGDPDEDRLRRLGFLRLARRVVEMMVECGISRCQGGVMAANPKWCQSTAEWHGEVDLRNPSPSPETILRAIVLYDLRYVAGDAALVAPLRERIFERVPKNPGVMLRLAELVVARHPPLNFLGRFVVDRKGGREVDLDVKERGLAPLRDAARLFALQYGLSKRYSTGSRWEDIGRNVPSLAEVAPLARQSYDELMRIRVLNGLSRGDSGRYLDPSTLTKFDRTRFANLFDVLRMVQQQVRNQFPLDPRYR